MRLRVECTLFCNLKRRAWTHAVLVIGLYELLGNPTTSLIEPPRPSAVPVLIWIKSIINLTIGIVFLFRIFVAEIISVTITNKLWVLVPPMTRWYFLGVNYGRSDIFLVNYGRSMHVVSPQYSGFLLHK